MEWILTWTWRDRCTIRFLDSGGFIFTASASWFQHVIFTCGITLMGSDCPERGFFFFLFFSFQFFFYTYMAYHYKGKKTVYPGMLAASRLASHFIDGSVCIAWQYDWRSLIEMKAFVTAPLCHCSLDVLAPAYVFFTVATSQQRMLSSRCRWHIAVRSLITWTLHTTQCGHYREDTANLHTRTRSTYD